MAPHQHVVLVPNAFGSKAFFDCDADCYDSMMATDAADYMEWAMNDVRVDALVPWHYYDEPASTEPCDLGAQSLPKTLKAWKRIGKQIVNAGRQQHDESLTSSAPGR